VKRKARGNNVWVAATVRGVSGAGRPGLRGTSERERRNEQENGRLLAHTLLLAPNA